MNDAARMPTVIGATVLKNVTAIPLPSFGPIFRALSLCLPLLTDNVESGRNHQLP